jgi:hypothetical protein
MVTRLFKRLAAIALACACAASAQVGPIVVSANHRYLQFKDGTPFFWLGDTAWWLFQKLDREETERYLENRRQKGFTVIQAVALHTGGERSQYGTALLDGDPTRPNVTPGEYGYWEHVDWIVDLAAKKGIYIGMLPCWGSAVKSGTLNATNAAQYARWLAERYRNRPNIFWIEGGDVRGDVHPEVWQTMGRTLKEVDPVHLITYHPFGRTQSSTWFHNEPWLDFNMFQSGHQRYDQDTGSGAKGEDNWRYVAEDYAMTPAKPTLDGEPSYEGIPQGLHDPSQPYWTDADARRYAYWSVFAGSCGHTYGSNAVEQMYKPGGGRGAFGVKNYWYEAIDDPGAGQMQYLKRLILSRPFTERVPDQSVIAGENGVRYDRVVATRGAGYLLAYTYSGRPFEIRMGVISGKQIRASWYNPRDGSSSPIGTFANQGIRKFTPPGTPGAGNDWVLAFDDASNKADAPVRR